MFRVGRRIPTPFERAWRGTRLGHPPLCRQLERLGNFGTPGGLLRYSVFRDVSDFVFDSLRVLGSGGLL